MTEDILHSTLALAGVTGADENRIYEAPVSLDLLRPGENQLAVEVHQSDPASSDLGFDLELIAVPVPAIPVLFWNGSGILSWSLAAAGFGLETTDSLESPVVWAPFDGPVELIDGKLQASIGLGLPRRFFRLKEF